ncbi:MAG: DUF1217 domain-containing protein [Bradyrhizobium sp.]|nr:MAG: DUF1217 domain-containing protein [Bradyrhizobium sp.]
MRNFRPKSKPEAGRRSGRRRRAIKALVTALPPACGVARPYGPDASNRARGRRRGQAVSTTTSTYLSIENNLSSYQRMVESQPAVKTATAYYAANIGNVNSISDLVNNYRLLSYALDAYGLGNQVQNKALVTKVLEGGTTSPNALANTLGNPNWAKFAAAFNFAAGASSISSAGAVSTTKSNYVEQTLETDEGQQDVGVQLALYFQRVAPTITSSYNVLGDKNLLEAFQTIFGVTLNSNGNIDSNAAIVNRLMPVSDLSNPTKLKQLTERFTAEYTLDYGPGGVDSGSPITAVSGTGTTTNTNAATSIMSSIISGNSTFGGSSAGSSLDSTLLSAMQNLPFGG